MVRGAARLPESEGNRQDDGFEAEANVKANIKMANKHQNDVKANIKMIASKHQNDVKLASQHQNDVKANIKMMASKLKPRHSFKTT